MVPAPPVSHRDARRHRRAVGYPRDRHRCRSPEQPRRIRPARRGAGLASRAGPGRTAEAPSYRVLVGRVLVRRLYRDRATVVRIGVAPVVRPPAR